MPTSVALGPRYESFVRKQVASGRYNNVSEVLRAGLRLLEQDEKLRALKLRELKAAIAEGLAGEALADEAVFSDVEAAIAHAESPLR
jgi:antitoxin ParD1/3/4